MSVLDKWRGIKWMVQCIWHDRRLRGLIRRVKDWWFELASLTLFVAILTLHPQTRRALLAKLTGRSDRHYLLENLSAWHHGECQKRQRWTYHNGHRTIRDEDFRHID